jgi:hypothetical protein
MLITNLSSDFEKVKSRTRIGTFDILIFQRGEYYKISNLKMSNTEKYYISSNVLFATTKNAKFLNNSIINGVIMRNLR